MRPFSTFRSRILGLVVAVGVVPLALLGLWMAFSSARSGEALLRDRLQQTLDEAAEAVTSNWTVQRSALLDLAESPELRGGGGSVTDVGPPEVVRAWLEAPPHLVHRIVLLDLEGTSRWSAASALANDEGESDTGEVTVELEVYRNPLGPASARLRATLDAQGLLGPVTPTVAGTVIGAFDPESGAPLLPLPFDPALLGGDRFVLAGDEWLAARRSIREPALEIVAAAPLTPFTRPFQDAARRGTILLILVASVGMALALLLAGRLTRSLERLARAADAVARGDLEQQVEGARADEVGRVARAFNAMTRSLRSTLAELADRRALAAVGEFAASLAHEVRNPLTSIKVDLQMVEERLPEGDALSRQIQARALADIARLDATLSGALHTARSGRIGSQLVDLGTVIRGAVKSAVPAVEEAGGRVEVLTSLAPAEVRGDAPALEQLVLNLLLNAAAAIGPDGRIEVEVGIEGEEILVTVRDDGRGIAEADLDRVFEPLYTTREGGSGLGLAVARRLTTAHGGRLTVTSRPGEGATLTLRLPRPLPAS